MVAEYRNRSLLHIHIINTAKNCFHGYKSLRFKRLKLCTSQHAFVTSFDIKNVRRHLNKHIHRICCEKAAPTKDMLIYVHPHAMQICTLFHVNEFVHEQKQARFIRLETRPSQHAWWWLKEWHTDVSIRSRKKTPRRWASPRACLYYALHPISAEF